jgi:triple functional domain protein
MTLFSLLKFARTLDEAEKIKKEHELFKSSLERVSVSVSILQSKAQRILIDHHHNQTDKTPTKFEQLMSTLNSKWQMLLIYIDNRTRLIMAQINFYKYTDQVMTVLESLELEYARDEDWYEKSKSEFDPEQYLQAQIQIHNQKKQSFLKACNWARRTGETFQKYSLRNICDAKLNTNPLLFGEIESSIKKIMDEIHAKEERTIKSWTMRKNSLDECFQYVIFEKSSKEALVWLNESENSYLQKFQNLGSLSENENREIEIDKLYKEFCDFTEKLRNQQGYVNLLIELSPKLLESSIRYGNNIAMWANKVETRYKEFFNVMNKVQQAYGLKQQEQNQQPATPKLNNTSSSSSSLSSLNQSNNASSKSEFRINNHQQSPSLAVIVTFF